MKSVGMLICESGPNAGQQIPLFPQAFTIGREVGCDLLLADGRVSRRHARLDWNGQGFLLSDLQSRNGILLNGQSIKSPLALKSGDRIAVGSSLLRVQLGPVASQVTPAQSPIHVSAPGIPNQRTPELQGQIEHIDGPVMERGDMLKPAAIGALGYLIHPALGVLGATMANQKGMIPVRYLRVRDALSGRIKSAKMRGEPSGLVSVGDQVQLWGKPNNGGGLDVQFIYNETTGEIIKLKL
ncbi:MAG: FHA domain-containing protein [Anaerolineae bacterium]